MSLFGGYDGSIKIDTKIDTSGFEKDASGMATTISKVFKDMSWGEQEQALQRVVELHGDAFSTMGPEQQAAAIQEVVNNAQEIAPAMDEAASSTDRLTASTGRMSVRGRGLARIMGALYPRMYRVRRVAVGFSEISHEMGKTAGAAGGVKLAIAGVLIVVALLAVAFALLLRAAIRWAKRTINELYSSLSATSAFRDKVVELKTAFDNVKGAIMGLGATLLNALMPIIMRIVDWLIRAINFIAMAIASLTGQKTVLQYVAGSMGSAAGSAERIEDAAKGALAAFDEIDVLQIDEPDGPLGGGAGVGGSAMLKEVDVPEDFLKDSWERIKEQIGKYARETADRFKERFIERWKTFENWWKESSTRLGKAFDEGGLFAMLDELDEIAREVLTSIWEYFEPILGPIVMWIWNNVLSPMINFFKDAWERIKWALQIFVAYNKYLLGLFALWIRTNVTEPIVNFFRGAWTTIENAAITAWLGIKNAVRNVKNGIILYITIMVNSAIRLLNGLISKINSIRLPSWMGGGGIGIPNISYIGGGSSVSDWYKYNRVPKLASGAVIPPNSAFAAVLGDQTSGTNIETPEALLRQIVQEESGSREATVKFAGTIGQFVRQLKPYIDKENARVGASLVTRSIS